MLKNLLKKKEQGFTIIEVMIVLAIAGLIIVVVLIAVPQLQRNQRNEARRSILGRISSEINNYAGNNNGRLPVANTAAGPRNLGNPRSDEGFFGRYLDCQSASGSGAVANCGIDINDPRTSFPVGTGQDGVSTEIATTGTEPGDEQGDLYYRTGVICDGELATTTGATARNFALIIRFEGGASYCLDNQ